jgi:hypothetical protein
MSRLVLNGLDLNNKQINGLADGSAATDAVTKQQLDAAIRGLDWKQEVVAASTANVTLASPGTTLDGVTLVANDRILLMNQTAPAENGIYVWTASGSALTRALDADSWNELSGSTVTVQRGTVNADRVYRVNSDDGGTLGTTAVTFAQIGAGGSAYTAGNGLTLSSNDFNVGAGTGISVAADTVGIDTAVVTRKFAAACVATTNPQTFNHALNNADVQVTVKRVSDNQIVDADVIVTDANNISVNFGGAPTAAQYRVRVDA